MTVIRIGGLLQPAWERTATAFAGTTSAFADKLQPAINKTAAISQEATNLVGAFLTPASMVAFVLALWRLGADLGWTGDFFVPNGLFSHWMVWMALAIVLKMTGSLINRAADPNESGEADFEPRR